jgi:hypothetical protein
VRPDQSPVLGSGRRKRKHRGKQAPNRDNDGEPSTNAGARTVAVWAFEHCSARGSASLPCPVNASVMLAMNGVHQKESLRRGGGGTP